MTRPLAEMDVVYITAEERTNEALRYSLRSVAANFPHRKVWLSGFQPIWLANVGYIPEAGGETKEARIYNTALAVAQHPDVSDQFVMFNDDFFITEPMTKMPMRYLQPLRKHCDEPLIKAGKDGWAQTMRSTLDLLLELGVKNPLSYELHVPMMFDKKVLAEVMEPYVGDAPPQLRSLYGNLANVGGIQQGDVKALLNGRNYQIPKPFFSTWDLTFTEYQPKLNKMFPTPSLYEQAGTVQSVLAAAVLSKLIARAAAAK
ncbi:hypothetical protein KIH27_09715 [Mycobacterium sp. M1]|uniref:Uncharacterized protein n=1 Tax=Mycolicibacter acidiphilus TaxID=2835306 RepID=A0ABS5RHT4_9MYCO|nr:hypothetical protein [Mycolicibacter acidiphilus]MBS9533860.1 hypothetical protein [Mycolicibacter acidiphilus]